MTGHSTTTMIRLSQLFRSSALGAIHKPGRGQLVPAFILFAAVIGSLFLFRLYGAHDSTFLAPLQPDGSHKNTKGTGLTGHHGTDAAPKKPWNRPPSNHPIDELISGARLEFNTLMGKRSLTLEQAALRYRERRGRHPPPGFDKWFAAALEQDAVVVEEFFDRIHHDINPFWGLAPHEIRRRAHNQAFMVLVRNGKARPAQDDKETHFRQQQWLELVQKIAPNLPDLDMFINHMDESRVMVPWDKLSEHVAAEQKSRRLIPPEQAITKYSGVADVEDAPRHDPVWLHGETHKFWDHVRDACPPDSPGRKVSSLPTFNASIEFPMAPVPEYTYKGYVKNFTASQDPCLQPHLRGMHGTFIEAISMSTTEQLMPLFGECKLPQNNEILIPSAMYLAEGTRKEYSGGGARGGPWKGKKDGVMWRGGASGARNKAEHWWHNHRHRFVQMLNGTTISAVEAGDEDAGPTFRLLPAESEFYPFTARKEGTLGAWVATWADVEFAAMFCDPPDKGPDGKPLKTCKHTDAFMRVSAGVPFERMYDWKYLPDVDGNSFSGRYRAFLQSTSLPLKSTIYQEWHDARLMPWVHFVPFDNSYLDIYGIMEYFFNHHDEEAERIALEGQTWANAVLRKEDMLLYTWRLLLEYARVMDDNRDRLAYVEDLMR